MRWIWNGLLVNRAPAWTAAATIVLVIFSGLLWKVSDKANETSVITQRAFLNFSGPIFQKKIDGKKLEGITVFYIMDNSGTTPAGAGIQQWNMSLGSTIPEKGLDFDALPQSGRLAFVLGPKANFQTIPINVSTEDLEMVAQGKARLFFWGWASYRDIFAATPPRLSEFCTQILTVTWSKPDHSDPSADIITSSPPCPTHNCYDEDCEDYRRRPR